jgi:Mg-chelatase subunit ChlD
MSAVSEGRIVLEVSARETSAATVGLLDELSATADQQPDPRAALTALLLGTRVDPGAEDHTGALTGLRTGSSVAVSVPEQAVLHYAGSPGAPAVVAVHPPSAGDPFDYPYAILRAHAGPGSVAGRLLAALRAPEGRALLRADGFRGPDGAGDGLGAGQGDATRPDPVTADELLKTLAAVQERARLLAVVDVSGSMATTVPGSGGSTRLDLALRAAAAGLQLYPDSTEVGLWSFSDDVTGSGDHQELVPIAPLSASGTGGRAALALAMTRLRPVPNGGTALYDTTLAAVRAARAGWDPTRVNAVIVLSDGEDTDADGIGLSRLLTTLRDEQASGRPVPVFTIAYGDGSGGTALAEISAATGGASYQVSDPSRIRDVFLDALGQRACRPQCRPTAEP